MEMGGSLGRIRDKTMIFVGGASGAGKTTALVNFVTRHPIFTHLRASEILRGMNRPIECPSWSDLEKNQRVLRTALLEFQFSSKVIVDGHITIPVGDTFFQVSASFFEGMPLNAFILMRVSPETLLTRRNIAADKKSIERVQALQKAEHQQMQYIAAKFGCAVELVDAHDENRFERLLLEYSTS